MRSQSFPRVTPCVAILLLVVAGPPAWAGRDCDAPPATWQPRSAVNALAERNGWRVERLKVDDGCYEIKGRDAEGRHLKVKIDPATLKVISIHREGAGQERDRSQDRDRDRDRTGERPRAAPPPTAPARAPTGQQMPASTPRLG